MKSFFTMARRWLSTRFQISGAGQPWHVTWVLSVPESDTAGKWHLETVSIRQELSAAGKLTVHQEFEGDGWAHPA